MATLQAQSLLARVGSELPLKAGLTTGTLPKGLHWRLHVERYGDAGDRRAWPGEVYQVVVEVWSGIGSSSAPIARLATLRMGAREAGR